VKGIREDLIERAVVVVAVVLACVAVSINGCVP